MTRRPKIIGHFMVDIIQQRSLAAGVTLDIPLTQFRETIKWAVQVGDLAWIKEPWCILMPHCVVLPGHFLSATQERIPEWIRTRGYELKFSPTGSGLQRKESRFTAEIMGYTPEGTVRLLIHERQVDQYLQALRAAA